MSNKKGFGYSQNKRSCKNGNHHFFGEKYVGFILKEQCRSSKSRNDSLRKSEAMRNVLFCCTFQGMTKQILRDNILSDKRIPF